MTTLRFTVSGSKGSSYEVVFSRDGDNLTATCTCPAGRNGKYCKHRFALMSGDGSSVTSGNADRAQEAQAMVTGTDVAIAWSKLVEAETDLEDAKRHASACKKALALAMRD